MFKKLFVLIISMLSVLTIVACDEAEALLSGNVPTFDKPLYFVTFGQEVEFSVGNVEDLSTCLIVAGDASVLSVEGNKVTAIKTGASTLSVINGDKVATASVVVNPKKLDVPALSVSNGIVSWNAVENANEYIVKIDNSLDTILNTSFDMSKFQAGRYTVSVAAKSKDENYTTSDFSIGAIHIDSAAFEGVVIEKYPTKTVYNEGERVSLAGLKMLALYDNGTSKDISGLVACDKSIIYYGDTSFTVSYEGFDFVIEITVNPRKLTTPVLSVVGEVVSWTEVENSNGYLVSINGDEQTVFANEINLSHLDAGAYVVSVSALPKDETYAASDFGTRLVTIDAPALSGLEIIAMPSKLAYTDGQSIDLEGLQVFASFNKGADVDVTKLVECDKATASYGDTSLLISFGSITLEIAITVSQSPLMTPSITVEGEAFSWNEVEGSNGYLVTINDKTTLVFENSIDLSGYAAASYSVSVVALAKNENNTQSDAATATVVVNAPVLLSLEFESLPTKRLYNDGDSVSLVGLKATAHYNKGGSVDVTGLVSCDKATVSFEDSVYTLSFEGFGREVSIYVKPSLTVKDGEGIVSFKYIQSGETVSLNTPSKQGYSFVGWYMDDSFYFEFDGVMPQANTTVYARWISGSVVVVSEGESIQAAIDNASANSTILVKAGAYAEYLTINKPVTLLGNNFGRGVGEARLPETYLYPASGEDFNVYWSAPIVDISSSFVTLDGFEINGDNPMYANIWTAERNDEVQNSLIATYGDAFTLSAIVVRDAYNAAVGTDIGVDVAVGVRAFREDRTASHLQSVVVKNSSLTNFIHAAILFNNNNRSITGDPADKYADNSGNKIENNTITNVMSYGLVRQDKSYVGGYGMSILTDTMATDIMQNSFVGNNMGMQITGDVTLNNTTNIKNNTFLNNAVSIWLNAMNQMGGVNVENNTFDCNADINSLVGVSKNWNNAMILSGVESGSVTIAQNTISNFEAAILINNTREDSILITNNTLSNNGVAISLTPYFLSYTSLTAQTHASLFDNKFAFNGQNVEIQDSSSACYLVKHVDSFGQVVDTDAKGVFKAPVYTLNKNGTITVTKQAFASKYDFFVNDEVVYTYFVTDESPAKITFSFEMMDYVPEVYKFYVVVSGIEGMTSATSIVAEYAKITAIKTQYAGTTTTVTNTIGWYVVGTAVTNAIIPSPIANYVCDYYGNEDLTEPSVAYQSGIVSASQTVYCIFRRNATYSYYDANNVLVDTVVYGHGDFASFEAEQIEGQIFVGWYSNINRAETYKVDTTQAVVGAANKSLYPRYILATTLIENEADLEAALKNQAANQVWAVKSGVYSQDLTITKATIHIIGIDEIKPVFSGRITITANNVSMTNIFVSQTYTSDNGDRFANEGTRFVVSGQAFNFCDGVIERTSYVAPAYGYLIYYNNKAGALTIINSVLKAPYLMASGANPYQYVNLDSPQAIGVEAEGSTNNSLVLKNSTVETSGYVLFDRTVRATLDYVAVRGIKTMLDDGKSDYFLAYMLNNSTRMVTFTVTNSSIETFSMGILLGTQVAIAKLTINYNTFKCGGIAICLGNASWGFEVVGTVAMTGNTFDLATSGRGIAIADGGATITIKTSTFVNQTRQQSEANERYVIKYVGNGTATLSGLVLDNCREDSIVLNASANKVTLTGTITITNPILIS